MVCLDELLEPIEFLSAKPATVLQPHGDQPEFGKLLVALDVHMGWLMTVPRIEEESVRAKTQDSWHNA